MSGLPDTAPPWVAFPEMQPHAFSQYLKQGATEAWFDQVWRPFWSSLSAEEKQRYLERHQASPQWAAAIKFVCDADATVDLEADARESAAHLHAWRASRRKKRSWIKRLLGGR